MINDIRTYKNSILYKAIIFCLLLSFGLMSIAPQEALSQTLAPAINTLIPLSPAFTPTLVRGIRVYPDNPLKFDFIVDSGDSGLQGDELKSESEKLIRYFLASLTLPENDLWVNLSPYEKDRIVPQELGTTEMGIDMLAQDYLLKQITASLTNPDSDLGKEFWAKIYKQSYEKFGTTNVPVDTFNKVWIMPDKAEVYVQEDKAFVVESRLKVMLESDYLAAQVNSEKHLVSSQKSNEESLENGEEKHQIPDTRYPSQAQNNSSLDTIHSSLDTVSSQIVREVFIPVLEKEVNEGKNFAQLRQIYNSIILSYWYKTNLKESILNKVYADKRKVKGLEVVNSEKYLVSSQKSNEESLENGEEKHQIPDTRYPSQVQSNSLPDTIHSSPDTVQIIYQQYLQTFKKGVCNMMKVEYDPYAKKNIPRKYFAGGEVMKVSSIIKVYDLTKIALQEIILISQKIRARFKKTYILKTLFSRQDNFPTDEYEDLWKQIDPSVLKDFNETFLSNPGHFRVVTAYFNSLIRPYYEKNVQDLRWLKEKSTQTWVVRKLSDMLRQTKKLVNGNAQEATEFFAQKVEAIRASVFCNATGVQDENFLIDNLLELKFMTMTPATARKIQNILEDDFRFFDWFVRARKLSLSCRNLTISLLLDLIEIKSSAIDKFQRLKILFTINQLIDRDQLLTQDETKRFLKLSGKSIFSEESIDSNTSAPDLFAAQIETLREQGMLIKEGPEGSDYDRLLELKSIIMDPARSIDPIRDEDIILLLAGLVRIDDDARETAKELVSMSSGGLWEFQAFDRGIAVLLQNNDFLDDNARILIASILLDLLEFHADSLTETQKVSAMESLYRAFSNSAVFPSSMEPGASVLRARLTKVMGKEYPEPTVVISNSGSASSNVILRQSTNKTASSDILVKSMDWPSFEQRILLKELDRFLKDFSLKSTEEPNVFMIARRDDIKANVEKGQNSFISLTDLFDKFPIKMSGKSTQGFLTSAANELFKNGVDAVVSRYDQAWLKKKNLTITQEPPQESVKLFIKIEYDKENAPANLVLHVLDYGLGKDAADTEHKQRDPKDPLNSKKNNPLYNGGQGQGLMHVGEELGSVSGVEYYKRMAGENNRTLEEGTEFVVKIPFEKLELKQSFNIFEDIKITSFGASRFLDTYAASKISLIWNQDFSRGFENYNSKIAKLLNEKNNRFHVFVASWTPANNPGIKDLAGFVLLDVTKQKDLDGKSYCSLEGLGLAEKFRDNKKRAILLDYALAQAESAGFAGVYCAQALTQDKKDFVAFLESNPFAHFEELEDGSFVISSTAVASSDIVDKKDLGQTTEVVEISQTIIDRFESFAKEWEEEDRYLFFTILDQLSRFRQLDDLYQDIETIRGAHKKNETGTNWLLYDLQGLMTNLEDILENKWADIISIYEGHQESRSALFIPTILLQLKEDHPELFEDQWKDIVYILTHNDPHSSEARERTFSKNISTLKNIFGQEFTGRWDTQLVKILASYRRSNPKEFDNMFSDFKIIFGNRIDQYWDILLSMVAELGSWSQGLPGAIEILKEDIFENGLEAISQDLIQIFKHFDVHTANLLQPFNELKDVFGKDLYRQIHRIANFTISTDRTEFPDKVFNFIKEMKELFKEDFDSKIDNMTEAWNSVKERKRDRDLEKAAKVINEIKTDIFAKDFNDKWLDVLNILVVTDFYVETIPSTIKALKEEVFPDQDDFEIKWPELKEAMRSQNGYSRHIPQSIKEIQKIFPLKEDFDNKWPTIIAVLGFMETADNLKEAPLIFVDLKDLFPKDFEESWDTLSVFLLRAQHNALYFPKALTALNDILAREGLEKTGEKIFQIFDIYKEKGHKPREINEDFSTWKEIFLNDAYQHWNYIIKYFLQVDYSIKRDCKVLKGFFSSAEDIAWWIEEAPDSLEEITWILSRLKMLYAEDTLNSFIPDLIKDLLKSKQKIFAQRLENLTAQRSLLNYPEHRPLITVLLNSAYSLDARIRAVQEYLPILVYQRPIQGFEDKEDLFLKDLKESLQKALSFEEGGIPYVLENEFVTGQATNSSFRNKLQKLIRNHVNDIKLKYIQFIAQQNISQEVLDSIKQQDPNTINQLFIFGKVIAGIESDRFSERDKMKLLFSHLIRHFFQMYEKNNRDLKATLPMLSQEIMSWDQDDLKILLKDETLTLLGNKALIDDLVHNAGYDPRLWQEGIRFTYKTMNAVTRREQQQRFIQNVEYFLELAEKIVDKHMTLPKTIDSYEKAQDLFAEVKRKVPQLSENQEHLMITALESIKEIEGLDAVEDDQGEKASTEGTFYISIQKDFLNEISAGEGGHFGCFAPMAGHGEMPGVIALEAGTFFIQIYDARSIQVANAVVVLTKDGAYVDKAWGSSKYSLDEIFAQALLRLTVYVPNVMVSSFGAGHHSLSKITKKGAAGILNAQTPIFHDQYGDSISYNSAGRLAIELGATTRKITRQDYERVLEEQVNNPAQLASSDIVTKKIESGQELIDLFQKNREKGKTTHIYHDNHRKLEVLGINGDQLVHAKKEDLNIFIDLTKKTQREKVAIIIEQEKEKILSKNLRQQKIVAGGGKDQSSLLLSNKSENDIKGGIDFNAKNMSVSVKGEGAKDFRVKGIEEKQDENASSPLPLYPSIPIDFDNFQGLVPVIINIAPINLLEYLTKNGTPAAALQYSKAEKFKATPAINFMGMPGLIKKDEEMKMEVRS